MNANKDKEVEIGPALSYTELGKLYSKMTNSPYGACTLDGVWDWAAAKTDIFRVTEDGTIHEIQNKKE